MRTTAVALGAALLTLTPAETGLARQSDVVLDVLVSPETVVLSGANVTFTPVLLIPVDEAVTITSIESGLHGDVTDATNPAIVATTCTVPDPVAPGDSFGAYDWGCEYQVVITGDPGTVTDTITVRVIRADDTEVMITADASVTIGVTTGSIRGTLVDDQTDEPIAGVRVMASGDSDSSSATTDHLGGFGFEGLDPGEYRLVAGNLVELTPSDYAVEYYDDATFGSADLVTVFAGEVTTIEWDLAFGGIVQGIVTDASTSEPLEGVEVDWVGLNTDGSRLGPHPGIDSDERGAYQVRGLHAIDVLVCFSKDGYVDECWDDRTDFGSGLAGIPGDPITAAPRSTVGGIDAALAPIAPPATTTTTPPTSTTVVAQQPVDVLPPTGSSLDVGLSIVALATILTGTLAMRTARRVQTS